MANLSLDDHSDRLLIQIASYNTNLQGVLALPQDLVDWLAPTLQVSSFLSRERRAPDIVAVGFQELLPLHLGLTGYSKSVIDNRNALILSQIEAHAPNKERYSLIARIVNVGVALLVYGLDDGIARRVCDVQTQWTGTGPAYMGNKGAVGVRFRVPGADGGVGETFTFVNAHLTAYEDRLASRLADYKHIVGSLLFPPISPDSLEPSTLYATSHLFFFGDLNFRMDIPSSHSLSAFYKRLDAARVLDDEKTRAELKEFDQLVVEQRKGNVCTALREGEFWKFKCSYKYLLGEVDRYNTTRIPSWTDRVLYTTHTDSPDNLDKSDITNILYTSIPGYTTSDHKPVVCVLLLPRPAPTPATTLPTIRLPSTYTPVPDPLATLKRYVGRTLDRIIGICWWFLVLLGAGSSAVGVFNFVLGIGALTWWRWWKSKNVGVGHATSI
ncbi:Inositol polyphosphate 5-phosphatase OCRL-1 [Hypsizygus marmoreus]|uniref:Inositol polyphosphate 5-phosphatase OCRL-1 n=1 Tax=Hypsizygus marmoreus TaxID=39966 RepID=A0A369JHW9_HYPMA|nr:Inositol polyphosphate 5-phosphatase OCRL-1 [Hypsizygus marmoreus]